MRRGFCFHESGQAHRSSFRRVQRTPAVVQRRSRCWWLVPEQLYGEIDIDSRIDVWAMGVVLFECLSTQRPLVPDLPSQLGMMVDTMLTRDRAARAASVQPVVAAAEWRLAPGIA